MCYFYLFKTKCFEKGAGSNLPKPRAPSKSATVPFNYRFAVNCLYMIYSGVSFDGEYIFKVLCILIDNWMIYGCIIYFWRRYFKLVNQTLFWGGSEDEQILYFYINTQYRYIKCGASTWWLENSFLYNINKTVEIHVCLRFLKPCQEARNAWTSLLHRDQSVAEFHDIQSQLFHSNPTVLRQAVFGWPFFLCLSGLHPRATVQWSCGSFLTIYPICFTLLTS
jgi:hypothetical protein